MVRRKRRIPDSAAATGASPDSRLLEFSFKHLDFDNLKFNPDNCKSDYLCNLLRCVKKYSNYTVEQFTNFNHDSDRNTVNPERLQQHLSGTMADDQLLFSESWEFKIDPEAKITPNSLWRAHGVIIGNVFYVVWLDPKHKLFESHHPKHS